jgi:hypothetical protein
MAAAGALHMVGHLFSYLTASFVERSGDTVHAEQAMKNAATAAGRSI